MMEKAPDSYLDNRRPPLREALVLEGGTVSEATEALQRKGYFTPPPRPWVPGSFDRGFGRKSFAVLDKFGDVVVEAPNLEIVTLIVEAVNRYDTLE